MSVQAASSGPDPETASVVVSGAGTETSNGTFPRDGSQNGKPYYINGVIAEILWDGTAWLINDGSVGSTYQSAEDVAYPWLVAVWTVVDGVPPAPTVIIG